MPILETLAVGALGVSAIGALGNVWAQVLGLQEGRKENRSTRAANERMWERAEGIRQRERREDVAIRKEEFAETKSMNRFNKRQSFINTALTQLNRKPGLVNNFIAAQRGRR